MKKINNIIACFRVFIINSGPTRDSIEEDILSIVETDLLSNI